MRRAGALLVLLVWCGACSPATPRVASHATGTVDDLHTTTVNLILGDRSFVEAFGRLPTSDDPDSLRIETHLRYVVETLTEHPPEQGFEASQRRAQQLLRLQTYIDAGRFPYNDGHSDERRPTFIDETGAICAVGYLMEQDLAGAVVEDVAARHRYDFVPQIDHPAVIEWAATSGLTGQELAMIQPAYGWEPDPYYTEVEHFGGFTTLDRMDGRSRHGFASSLVIGDGRDGVAHREDVFLQIVRGGGQTGYGGYAGFGFGSVGEGVDVSNLDVGAFMVHEVHAWARLIGRVGAILPTAGDTPMAADLLTARTTDLALAVGNGVGGRFSFSPMVYWAGCADFLAWVGTPRTCYTRLDVGTDVVSVDGSARILTRAGFGFGIQFPLATGAIEWVSVADGLDEDTAWAHSVALSTRWLYPWWMAGDAWFQPGLTVAFPFGTDAEGWVATLDVHFLHGYGTR